LEEVADGIRTELAKPKAQARLDDIKKQVVDSLTRFNRRYTRWEMAAQDESRAEEPQFKLDDLAQSLGFAVGETPLVDRLSVKDHELGKAEVGGFQFVPLTFDQMAFDEDLPPYNARSARATDGAEFVYWRTKVQEAYVPSLADIRPDVVYAWKFQRARELARAKAKDLASQANKAQKLAMQAGEAQTSPEDVVRTPLKEVFAGDAEIAARLFETGDFSWLTRGVNPFGMGGAELEISAVNGVEQAGEEFMRKVFALDLGEVGVAENQPESFVYVVRIDSSAPSLDIRRQIFLNAGLSDVVSSIINRNQGKLQNEWLADMNQQLKVTWVSQDEPSQDSSL
jgi:hypothetical protein